MAQQDDLFATPPSLLPPGLCWLKGETSLALWLPQIEALAEMAPWRRWRVPGGGIMSVESTNAGAVGWCSDRQGYRYERCDPLSGQPWPLIPPALSAFAAKCADQAGYRDFAPDSCLVNRYWPGARMGTHRDAGPCHEPGSGKGKDPDGGTGEKNHSSQAECGGGVP